MTELDRLHEIAEDVGRTVWLRDLGAALSETADAIEGGTRDISGYESDVLAWVEESGGLDAVKERMMPEDMSWPFYEDGEPVRIGGYWQQDGFDESVTYVDRISFAEDGVRLENEYHEVFYRYGERVKRPLFKVLDADGVEIRVGDAVWDIYTGERMTIDGITGAGGTYETCRVTLESGEQTTCDGPRLTHRAPVIAADGKPLREGETVWEVVTGDGYVVERIYSGTTEPDFPGHTVACRRPDDIVTHMFKPSQLTHERPDSWERLEEDAEKNPCDYFGFDGEETCGKCPALGKNCEQTMARDLVRRAKKLAERGQ